MQQETLLTTGDVARELNCTVQWAWRLVQKGRIPAQQIGGRWLITRRDLDQYKLKYGVYNQPPGR